MSWRQPGPCGEPPLRQRVLHCDDPFVMCTKQHNPTLLACLPLRLHQGDSGTADSRGLPAQLADGGDVYSVALAAASSTTTAMVTMHDQPCANSGVSVEAVCMPVVIKVQALWGFQGE